jgi:hypothetical protein
MDDLNRDREHGAAGITLPELEKYSSIRLFYCSKDRREDYRSFESIPFERSIEESRFEREGNLKECVLQRRMNRIDVFLTRSIGTGSRAVST